MSHRLNTQRAPAAALLLALGCAAQSASAGGTITFGDDKSITVGFGARASYSSVENGAPDGSSRSTDFNLDSVRLFLGGSLNKYIKGTFNTEKDADDNIKVLDAYAQFELMPEFNVWAGRMLPPSDRANLDGPYYLSTWTYPGVVSQYPAKFAGRDNGVTAWGKLNANRLVYSVGAYEGHNNVAGASSESDHLLFAGRVQYDFWDAGLDPAYYTSSTYYGKDVLSVALAGQYQKDGVGSADAKGDYKGWNIDGLLEKDLGAGVLNIEGAFYKYDTGGKSDTTLTAGPTANLGGLTQGKAYLVGAAFLFPQQVGWGKFQPFARYQKYDRDATADGGGSAPAVAAADLKQTDVGVNYVIDGHKARISASYTKNEATAVKDVNSFRLGLQVQY